MGTLLAGNIGCLCDYSAVMSFLRCISLASHRFVSVQFGSVQFGLVRSRSVLFGLVRSRSVRFSLVQFGSTLFGSIRLLWLIAPQSGIVVGVLVGSLSG